MHHVPQPVTTPGVRRRAAGTHCQPRLPTQLGGTSIHAARPQPLTSCTYTLVDHVGAGRASHITETPGHIRVDIARPHATPELCARITTLSRSILGQGAWLQNPSPRPSSQTTKASWLVVPTGPIATPIETRDHFIWAIREGHVSHRLLAEMNGWLETAVASGRWTQQWHPTPSGAP